MTPKKIDLVQIREMAAKKEKAPSVPSRDRRIWILTAAGNSHNPLPTFEG